MRYELILTSPAIELKDLQDRIYGGINANVSAIVLPAGLCGVAKSIHNYTYAAIVGYPYGIQSVELKIHEATEAIKRGIKTLDFVVNEFAIRNLEYQKIAEECLVMAKLAKDYKVEIRAVIEHRLESLSRNVKIARVLAHAGIETVVLSTGNMPENTADAIVNCYKIREESDLQVITYSHAWTASLIDSLSKAGGIVARTPNIHNIF